MIKSDMEISVVIPLYNKKDSVLRAINSILAQTYLPNEIIIVNDGSTDGSEKVVEELNHPLIQLVHQENAGVSAARNKGIEVAKSEWIAFLDADDYWDKTYLQTINQLKAKYPCAKVLATNYRYQLYTGDFKNTQINKIYFGEKSDRIMDNYFQVASSSNPPIWSSAVVVAKNELKIIGGFPVGVKSGEDLITWARLAMNNSIAYSLTPLSTFVLSQAHSYNDIPNRIPERPDFVGKELRDLYYSRRGVPGLLEYTAHWHKMRASDYLRLGKRRDCLKEILKSLRYSFFQPKVWLYGILLLFPTSMVHGLFKLKS